MKRGEIRRCGEGGLCQHWSHSDDWQQHHNQDEEELLSQKEHVEVQMALEGLQQGGPGFGEGCLSQNDGEASKQKEAGHELAIVGSKSTGEV